MIQQVEIVKPAQSFSQNIVNFIAGLIVLGIRTLIVWWAVEAWFPQLGLTYWQLVLPVYALRVLLLPAPSYRVLAKRK